MTKSTFTIFGITLVVALTLLAGSGCSSLTSKISLPSWGGTSSPKEIVAFWDTIIRTEGDQVYRGFAARVMFFDTGSKKAVRVKGNFDVYIFDEEATGKAAMIPAKIVRYQVTDLKALESNSKMFGKSYTLWVPWDELNSRSDEKKLSVFVRFKCDDGTIIVSKQATMTLPASPERMAEKAEIKYVDSQYDNRLRQISELTASATQRKNSLNSLDTEWKGTVAEHVISREVRPEMMASRTFNVPGVSRDGVPTIMPQRNFASATDEQKYMAQLMIANAQVVQNQQVNTAGNNLALQNQGFPINQVQFQSQGDNGAVYQQPMLQQTSQPSQGLSPMNEEAMYREFLNWKQQQAIQQHNVPQQMPQPPVGNYAAANTGTVWR